MAYERELDVAKKAASLAARLCQANSKTLIQIILVFLIIQLVFIVNYSWFGLMKKKEIVFGVSGFREEELNENS